ncbi:serine/threonine-protein kinase [Actinoplanes sp. NPDC051346]|uniref:serine/threonine-protein kinase n=1 Tax=Actinoplanes sp. NPDC051346 TaxID=3155048 RepID=UPI0034228A5F
MRGPLLPNDPRRLGGYHLRSRLGQGGMGTVYLAETSDHRPVAIKVVKPEYAHEEHFRARFRSEVNRAREVPPFCTAEVLDADADHEPPYLVVEYVDGPSLADIVTSQGPLSGGNLYSVAVGVATALAAIHGAGVIHRDLKPRNVLFALGTPKVIDFGIARAFEATSQHTGTDQLVGTVAYMAPERFDTDAAHTVGPAADVFAWGVVVAYAGTGRTPFDGDSAAATAAAILTRPPVLTGLPGPLRDLVALTLDKDPARRPSTVDLLDRLVATGGQDPGGTSGTSELTRAVQAVQRSGQRHNGGRGSNEQADTGKRPGRMPRAVALLLQLILGFALIVGLFAQIVVIPTAAAAEVAAYAPYAPLEMPLVTAAISFIACVQVGLVALIVLLRRTGAGTLFQRPTLTWAHISVGAAAAVTAVTTGLFLYVTFTDIPSPADGMDAVGLWIGAAGGVGAAVVLLLLTLIGRHLLLKAITLRSELDKVN